MNNLPPEFQSLVSSISAGDRDAFAAQALSGIMAKMASTTMPAGTRDALAKLAYQMADAMLAARDKADVTSTKQDDGFPNYDKTLKRWDEQ